MARFVSRVAFLASVLSDSFSVVEGNVFLGRELPNLHMNVDHLLTELEEVLGAGHREKAAARAASIEDGLRTTFHALPRNDEGLLEPSSVRYLLHRYFVDRHGWFVAGLDTAGDAWNASSATTVFAEHAEGAQNVFDKRMSRGMSLSEVALLGATLESLVHAETVQRLHAAYSVLGLAQVENHPSEEQAVHALDVYMLMYLYGEDSKTVTPEIVDHMVKNAVAAYPGWPETKKWIHEVRQEVLLETPLDRTSFDASVRVVEAVADRYGRWQNKECVDLKESLLKLENAGTGRVPLVKFYEAALNGAWQFSESKEYLQHLGALDETDAERPSVMISNYVNAPTNCVAASKFYNVCCINECEALLGYLEKEFAAPSASVQQIVELVQKLPSATQEAPRVLPDQLVKRLQEISDHHGGIVPFHARLFNQWLHHAYPRECPYPHLSNAVQPLKPDEFAAQTGSRDYFVEDEMRQYMEQGDGDLEPILLEELPWSEEEEHYLLQSAELESVKIEVSSSRASLRVLMFCFMAFSVVATFFRMTSQAKGALSETTAQKKVCV